MQSTTMQVAYTASNGAPEKRRALLTSTQGRLLGPGRVAASRGYHADSRCSARMYLGPHSVSSVSSILNDADLFTSYTTTLDVRTCKDGPANAGGGTGCKLRPALRAIPAVLAFGGNSHKQYMYLLSSILQRATRIHLLRVALCIFGAAPPGA